LKVTLDNLDGLGAVDYSSAVALGPGHGYRHAAAGMTIRRGLNVPSRMEVALLLEGSALRVPVRQARVVVSNDAGAMLFTGYLATDPVAELAGAASEGPVYRYALHGVSDEWLLDKRSGGTLAGTALAQAGGAVLVGLASRLGGAGLRVNTVSGRAVGSFGGTEPGVFSAHAGQLARATMGAYRAVAGMLSMGPVGGTQHAFQEGDGTLTVRGLSSVAVRELANDVTVSGELEPGVYWTEVFKGDGTTSVFQLTGEPAAGHGGHKSMLADEFTEAQLDAARWVLTDPGTRIGLGSGAVGAGGLTFTGGNGLDGQTTLVSQDALELGGTLVLELSGVQLAAGSAGVLGGLYQGVIAQANCFAGWNVRQSGGQTMVTPMVNGAETGSGFAALSGRHYTLRMRLHCTEMLRVRQAYYSLASGAVQQFGGGVQDAAVALVFEMRDEGASSNTPVTVSFDGGVQSSPATVRFCAVNSLSMVGSVARVNVARTGSVWVTSTDAQSGMMRTRLVGRASEGVDCAADESVTGLVTFFAGRVPAVGETVTVRYRGRLRAVARMANVASLAQEAAGGANGTTRWVGRVVRPQARCAEDCENAAGAILSFAIDRAAALSGSYEVRRPGDDIWPGDVLAVPANGNTANLIVRQVTVTHAGEAPEALRYVCEFANEWAEGLGVTLSEALAPDAVLPMIAGDSTVPAMVRLLPNLLQMSVVSLSSGSIAVDAGVAAPAGGGFEVRRRDGGWGRVGGAAGGSGDLVLRSPVRGFTIPRAAVDETFYVRMYDGSAVPLYSRASSAVCTHVALS